MVTVISVVCLGIVFLRSGGSIIVIKSLHHPVPSASGTAELLCVGWDDVCVCGDMFGVGECICVGLAGVLGRVVFLAHKTSRYFLISPFPADKLSQNMPCFVYHVYLCIL